MSNTNINDMCQRWGRLVNRRSNRFKRPIRHTINYTHPVSVRNINITIDCKQFK